METEPEILTYFGLSETFVRNQSEFMEKYEKMKVGFMFSWDKIIFNDQWILNI